MCGPQQYQKTIIKTQHKTLSFFNVYFLKISISKSLINEMEMYFRVLGVLYGVYTDVLGASRRFSVICCIYQHIRTFIIICSNCSNNNFYASRIPTSLLGIDVKMYVNI